MLDEHLQETYQYLFDAAYQALLSAQGFAPFGAGVRRTGEQIHTSVDLSFDQSQPADHISGLIAGFRADDAASGLIAAGLVFDTQMTDAGGAHARALCFHMEAADGRAVEVIVPYERLLGDQIDFMEPQITPVTAEIFKDVQSL